MRRSPLLAACVLAFSATTAHADDPARPRPKPPVDELPEPPRTQGDVMPAPRYLDSQFLTLTLHPLLLLNPVVSVGAELKLIDKLSVGGLVGVGRVNALAPTTGDRIHLGYFTAGMQLRYYVVQTFASGFFVALDADYTRMDSDQLISLLLYSTTAGLGVGPFVGFKLVLPVGATLDLSVGAKRIFARPAPSVSSLDGVGDQPGTVLLAVRLGVGWTF